MEDFVYNKKNFIAVKEELAQYVNIFKLIIENHKEHSKLLKLEKQSNKVDQFEDEDLLYNNKNFITVKEELVHRVLATVKNYVINIVFPICPMIELPNLCFSNT